MKKLHLTRFAAMATVALLGSTAAWAQIDPDKGYSLDEEYGKLTLFSTDNNAIKITASDVEIFDESDYGYGINTIKVERGAASASTPYITLMLPATVNVSEGYPVSAAYVPTGYHTGNHTLDFTQTTVIEANKPYLAETVDTPSEIIFKKNSGHYTIQPTGDNEHSTTLENSCWTFTGSYAKKTWETAPANVYGYAAASGDGYEAGQFVKVGNNVTLPPLRAYLTCTRKGLAKSSTDDVSNLPDVINVRLLGKSGETLSIGKMNTRTGEIQMQDRYYDLKGRKLNGKPQNKIMYVNKKVIKH